MVRCIVYTPVDCSTVQMCVLLYMIPPCIGGKVGSSCNPLLLHGGRYGTKGTVTRIGSNRPAHSFTHVLRRRRASCGHRGNPVLANMAGDFMRSLLEISAVYIVMYPTR